MNAQFMHKGSAQVLQRWTVLLPVRATAGGAAGESAIMECVHPRQVHHHKALHCTQHLEKLSALGVLLASDRVRQLEQML